MNEWNSNTEAHTSISPIGNVRFENSVITIIIIAAAATIILLFTRFSMMIFEHVKPSGME